MKGVLNISSVSRHRIDSSPVNNCWMNQGKESQRKMETDKERTEEEKKSTRDGGRKNQERRERGKKEGTKGGARKSHREAALR